MKKSNPTITQVITFHREGVLAHFSLSGLVRVREYARAQSAPLEFVFVLDKADPLTIRIVKDHPVVSSVDQIIEVSHGDLSSSRNSGISVSRGEYVGTMDGDDYCSANWPVAALHMLLAAKSNVVIHPELCVSFGTGHAIEHILDMSKDHFSPAVCLVNNPWISCSFGKREMYLSHPYHRTDLRDTGFGYEDWHWNVDLLAHDVQHICAPKTAYFYRRTAQSMLVTHASSGALIRPSIFFDQVDSWQDADIESDAT